MKKYLTFEISIKLFDICYQIIKITTKLFLTCTVTSILSYQKYQEFNFKVTLFIKNIYVYIKQRGSIRLIKMFKVEG